MSKNLLAQLEEDIELAEGTEFATESIQCPPGKYPATISKITRRHFSNEEQTFYTLSVSWCIEDTDVSEHCKQEKVYVNQDMFLNLKEESRFLDEEDTNDQLWVIDEHSNPAFGRFLAWAQAVGYERPKSWAKFWLQLSEDLQGKEGEIKVGVRKAKTKDLDEDGNPIIVERAVVNAVAPLN